MADKKTPAKAAKKTQSPKKGRIKKYFRDIRSEFKKISWPSKKQVWNNTLVVIVTVLIFGIVVWTLDFLLISGRDLLMGLF